MGGGGTYQKLTFVLSNMQQLPIMIFQFNNVHILSLQIYCTYVQGHRKRLFMRRGLGIFR